MESAVPMGGNLQQIDQAFEELDCFWLMWENDGWVADLPSPTASTARSGRYLKHIPFLPPIDSRPLVVRNQFVSQRWLDDMMGILQDGIPSSSYLQNHSFDDDQSCRLIEETIRPIHGKTISEILPEPRQADFIDLLEPERRESYETTLKQFAMGGEKQDADKEKGYSSRHFWRSFLGSHYSCMRVNCQLLQK